MTNMPQERRRFHVIALAATAVLVLGASGMLAWRLLDSGGATADPQDEFAETDAEWLELIAEAKRYKEDPASAWPEPPTPPGVQILRSCASIPAAAQQTQLAVEYSPDESTRRVIFTYFVPPDGNYHLILYEMGDLGGCDDRITKIVSGPDEYKESVDRHICQEMQLMADGLPRTDETLRPASPEVANAYLGAFCADRIGP